MKNNDRDPNQDPEGDPASTPQPGICHAGPGQNGLGHSIMPTAPTGGDKPAADHPSACAQVTSSGGNPGIKAVQSEPEAEDPVTIALTARALRYTNDPAVASTAARIAEIGADYLLIRAIDILDAPELYGGQDSKKLALSFLQSCPGDELEGWQVEDIIEEHFGLSQSAPDESHRESDPKPAGADSY